MNISIRRIGGSSYASAKIIEMNIESNGTKIVEDITNLHGYVGETLIESLREIADELEEQNNRLNQEQQ